MQTDVPARFLKRKKEKILMKNVGGQCIEFVKGTVDRIEILSWSYHVIFFDIRQLPRR